MVAEFREVEKLAGGAERLSSCGTELTSTDECQRKDGSALREMDVKNSVEKAL